jgi:peptide/nickel transport system permease protein
MAMTDTQILSGRKQSGALGRWFSMLWADKLAFFAALFLFVVLLCAILGPHFLDAYATKQNLRGRNAPPFDLTHGWVYVLGADALGRPLLARIVVAAQNTMLVAAGAVAASSIVGAALGLVAGYSRRSAAQWIMRLGDVIMS